MLFNDRTAKWIHMFSLFKKDPSVVLENKRKKLLEEAMHVQRSGDLKLYASKMEAIDKLEREIEENRKKISWVDRRRTYPKQMNCNGLLTN